METIYNDKTNLEFAKKVYDIVATVPKGKVATYGQIAKMAGDSGAAQEVGRILNRVDPIRNLPCHRVVNIKGGMAPGYCLGGADRQRGMLKKEGVKFLPDGRIDLKKSLLGAVVEKKTATKPQRRAVKPKTVVTERRSAGKTSSSP